MGDKLQQELHLTIINIEKEIGTLISDKKKNRSTLKDFRRNAVLLEKRCRGLIRMELRRLGESADDSSDESDDFGPDPILEKYERRIRAVFRRHHEKTIGRSGAPCTSF